MEGQFALHHHDEKTTKGKTFNYDTLRCENCGNLTMAFWSRGKMHDLYGLKVLPFPLKVEKSPKEWPPDIGRFWLQAKRSKADKNYDAATVMARTALQLALRSKGAVGKNLQGEIADLASKGLLPPIMREWADELRLLANDSAHPAPGQNAPEPSDVTSVLRFLDLLLEYLFTLPSQIEAFRKRKGA